MTLLARARGLLGAAVVPLVLLACGEPHPTPIAGSSHSASATPDQLTLADRVAFCERTHGLNGAHVKQMQVPVTTFASCDWPPPSWADADGYTRISVTSTQGPGTFEATGTNIADPITAPCPTLTVGYVFGSQGAYSTVPPITIRARQVMTSGGKPFDGPFRSRPVSRSASSSVTRLFRLVAVAYETRSLILTSKWAFEQRTNFLPDAATATAILDRLLHHCQMVVISGDSYRLREEVRLAAR